MKLSFKNNIRLDSFVKINPFSMLHKINKELLESRNTLVLRKVPKGKQILSEGVLAKEAFLIRKGLFRKYYYENGEEVGHQFFSEGDIILSARGLYLGKASRFLVEAIEPSEVEVLEINNYLQKENLQPLTKVFCTYLLKNEALELIHATKNIDLRYKLFLDSYPQLINRIPLKWVASLLQMHPTTLSKVRRRVMEKDRCLNID